MVGRLSHVRGLLFVVIPTLVYAQGTPSQVELNGFLIGQYKEVVNTTFGEPYQTQKDENDGSTAEAHVLDRALGAYMVFRYVPAKLNQIAAIQITGRPGIRSILSSAWS